MEHESAPTHMPRVNTCVRGHGSADRHDEWLKVPTRRDEHTGSQREGSDVWSQPPTTTLLLLLIATLHRIPFTLHTDP